MAILAALQCLGSLRVCFSSLCATEAIEFICSTSSWRINKRFSRQCLVVGQTFCSIAFGTLLASTVSDPCDLVVISEVTHTHTHTQMIHVSEVAHKRNTLLILKSGWTFLQTRGTARKDRKYLCCPTLWLAAGSAVVTPQAFFSDARARQKNEHSPQFQTTNLDAPIHARSCQATSGSQVDGNPQLPTDSERIEAARSAARRF